MTTDGSVTVPKALRDTKSVTLATTYLDLRGRESGEHRILRHWRGDFYRFADHIYKKLEPEDFRAEVHEFLKGLKISNKGRLEVFKPEPRNVKAVLDTLAAECQVAASSMPIWIDKHRPSPADVVAFRNGLLDLSEAARNAPVTIPPTPFWFRRTVAPFDFRQGSSCPTWHAFLRSSLKKRGTVDQGSIDLLQEWFGYCMTSDTKHQKLMMLLGPPRCGKGTIFRVLRQLVGLDNCVSPQFAALNRQFGLMALIGKRVATMPDAHLGREDHAVGVLDRLLQISGEDSVLIDRKNRDPLPDVKLGVRFMIGANEPPDLPDSSGAIITRLLMIQFHESFVGREDREMDAKLSAELPGIACWAIDGLKRLRKVGQFTTPTDADVLKNDYERQTSPIFAFLEDRCEFGSTEEHWVVIDDLYRAWKDWAERNGCGPIKKDTLGKRIRAKDPRVSRSKRSIDHRQVPIYLGVRLRVDGELPFDGGSG